MRGFSPVAELHSCFLPTTEVAQCHICRPRQCGKRADSGEEHPAVNDGGAAPGQQGAGGRAPGEQPPTAGAWGSRFHCLCLRGFICMLALPQNSSCLLVLGSAADPTRQHLWGFLLTSALLLKTVAAQCCRVICLCCFSWSAAERQGKTSCLQQVCIPAG